MISCIQRWIVKILACFQAIEGRGCVNIVSTTELYPLKRQKADHSPGSNRICLFKSHLLILLIDVGVCFSDVDVIHSLEEMQMTSCRKHIFFKQ